jgi:hypothetical protein
MRSPATPRLALVTLLSVVTLACADPTSPTASSDMRSDAHADTPEAPPVGPFAPDGDGDPLEPPARPQPAPDLLRPDTCDAATEAGIGATVSAQLDAFARDDIVTAYGLTSASFRRTFDVGVFAQLIRRDYPYLLESSGHRLDECWAIGRRGYILVGVRVGPVETVLRYDVSEEPGAGWRIDGAVALPGISLPAERLV